MSEDSHQERYLTRGEVRERYGISRTTQWRYEKKGVIPPGVQIGPGVERFRLSDLVKSENEK